MSNKGRRFPSEAFRTTDERTGATVWQMTDHPSINHNLYFLSDSLLPGEDGLVFASFRSGCSNFYLAGFPEGEIIQLTDAPDINSFSAIISDDGSRLFFTRGSAIVVLNLSDLTEQVLAEFPSGNLGEVDLSADRRWVVSAIRWTDGNGIVVVATDGSGGAVIHRQDRVIIHPQFHPTDPDLIEYAADPAPRMHLIQRDGSQNRCLYEHDNDEFVVHETWLGHTGDLVFTVWPKSIKRMDVATRRITTIADFNAWHICPSRDATKILCDTNHPDIGLQLVDIHTGQRNTVCHPASSNGGSQWPKGRYALAEDFAEAARAGGTDVSQELNWTDMKTDTIYGPQWTHPHPSLSRSQRYATFTSDRTGHPQVYVVELK